MRASIRRLALLALISLFSLSAFADGHDSWHKYRAAVMDVLKGHVSALSMVVFNQVEDTGFAQTHADGLAAAAKELGAIFPEGSGADSDALPAIWEQPDKFAEAVAAAEQGTAALAAAVKTGDRKAIAGAFKQTADACKGCHENFRAEED